MSTLVSARITWSFISWTPLFVLSSRYLASQTKRFVAVRICFENSVQLPNADADAASGRLLWTLELMDCCREDPRRKLLPWQFAKSCRQRTSTGCESSEASRQLQWNALCLPIGGAKYIWHENRSHVSLLQTTSFYLHGSSRLGHRCDALQLLNV
jgi:hypothetical protein